MLTLTLSLAFVSPLLSSLPSSLSGHLHNASSMAPDTPDAPTGASGTIVDSSDIFGSLRGELNPPRAEILTPGSPGYEESIKRWSDTCEKRAVRMPLLDPHISSIA